MNKRTTKPVIIAAIIALGALVSCSFGSKGAEIFKREKCRDCHTLNGTGGAVGPNLTYVGSRRSRDYILQQIRDPKSHNPRTEMPSFGERISEQDINALADYLAGMK
ncbi:MAG: c-type cytochrome [Nitrospirota bacterium]